MNKEDLVKIVDKVCAAWNQSLAANSKKEMYTTWFHVLQDLEAGEVDRVIDDLIVEDDRFMPRVGTVRKRVLSSKVEAPPEPIVAWQQLRAVAESAHNGDAPDAVHELVRVSLARLGGVSALGLHTNGDREMFITVYRSVVAEWERDNYGINRN